MMIRTLQETPPAAIVGCLLQAFENYYVKMPSDQEYWIKRWQGARVNYQLSAGVFDGEKLVGFILHGVDTDHDGKLTAFNCATGVLPDYRRKGIVKDLYDFLAPMLISAGVEKCGLEVITRNNIAIHSYEKVGFGIVKEYKCFFGQLTPRDSETPGFDFCKTDTPVWEQYDKMRACNFSWENSDKAVKVLEPDAYEAWQLQYNKELAGYAILKPNGHIVQFGTREPEMMDMLFDHIARITSNVRIINIEEKEKRLAEFFVSRGLVNTIDQYYMEYNLN
jgi:ribosomal protein S18 acetylase RimI-like enzyme